jgi:PEP-CTERM motif
MRLLAAIAAALLVSVTVANAAVIDGTWAVSATWPTIPPFASAKTVTFSLTFAFNDAADSGSVILATQGGVFDYEKTTDALGLEWGIGVSCKTCGKGYDLFHLYANVIDATTVPTVANNAIECDSDYGPCDVPMSDVSVSFTPAASQVPEPRTLALFGAGLVGLGVARRMTSAP